MRFPLKGLAGCTVAASLLASCASLSAQQKEPPAQQAEGSKPGTANSNSPADPQTQKSTKPATAQPSTAADNPFPEEQSQAAQKEAADAARADRKAADTGSVAPDSNEGSSSRDKLAGMDILGDHESRISNGAGGAVVDPKLSLADVKVGQQYLGNGNYQGAYERFKEACAVNPANLDAVFYLAEAARKVAHLDESAQNYRIYLEAQPDGSKAKAARKALTQLQGK